MLDAAERMQRCMDAVHRYKDERGIPIDPEIDWHDTGLLGTGYTSVTTTLGAVEAKRTSANPDMAALCVRLLLEAGVTNGGRVACCFSALFLH
jgi:poly-gamma-glutamate system protein